MQIEVGLGKLAMPGAQGPEMHDITTLSIKTADGLQIQLALEDEQADGIEQAFAKVRKQRSSARTGIHLPDGGGNGLQIP